MKGIYALLWFSGFVLVVWYSFAGYMVYQLTKDTGIWAWCYMWINRWIKWRYGLGT